MTRPKGNRTVAIVADVRQGQEFQPTAARVTLPKELLARGEEVYCVVDASFAELGAKAGDLLIVEPKKTANTGELVLAREGDVLWVGRWWGKHGRRDVVGPDGQTILSSRATVFGSVNLIVRGIHER